MTLPSLEQCQQHSVSGLLMHVCVCDHTERLLIQYLSNCLW